ncbi:MAG: hypothetical protein UGF89_10570, partial [Acutalibacteraceae bacterium]|nr:hypothetical protein [Acutalibacteraceae bacterium]
YSPLLLRKFIITAVTTAAKYIKTSKMSPVPEMIFKNCRDSHIIPKENTNKHIRKVSFFVVNNDFKPEIRLNAHR